MDKLVEFNEKLLETADNNDINQYSTSNHDDALKSIRISRASCGRSLGEGHSQFLDPILGALGVDLNDQITPKKKPCWWQRLLGFN